MQEQNKSQKEEIKELQTLIEDNLEIYRSAIWRKDPYGNIFARDYKLERLHDTLNALYELVRKVGNLNLIKKINNT